MAEQQADPNVPLSDDYLKAHANDPDIAQYLTSEERRRLSRLRVDAAKAAGQPTMGAPTGNEPVTLGDLLEDPSGSARRAGHLLVQGAMDPKVWAGLAASYLVPKATAAIRPGVMGAARVMGRGANSVMDANPDLVGIVSPRAANALRVAQAARQAMRGAPESTPSSPTPSAASAETAAPPVPTPSQARQARASGSTPPAAVETPLELTRRLKAENRAAQSSKNAKIADSNSGADQLERQHAEIHGADAELPRNGAPAFDLNSLSREEQIQALKWYEAGMPPERIIQNIEASRKLTGSLKTPTPEEAARAVAERNRTGRWEP